MPMMMMVVIVNDDDDGENADVNVYRSKAEFPGLPSLAFHPLSGDIYTGLTNWQKYIFTDLIR